MLKTPIDVTGKISKGELKNERDELRSVDLPMLLPLNYASYILTC